MYHIKNDKRQIDSALRLMKGLTKCLQDHKMLEISVSDLCTVSGVSRSTFYRMFETPLDLLEYTSDSYVSKAIADYSTEVFKTQDDFILYSLIYWNNHTDLLEALINCGRLDIIQKSFENQSSLLEPILESQFDEDELAYFKAGAAGLITSIIALWIRRGKKETPTQMFEFYRKIIQFKI